MLVLRSVATEKDNLEGKNCPMETDMPKMRRFLYIMFFHS